jgi:hypothetical protein
LKAWASGIDRGFSPELNVPTDPRFGRFDENFGECELLVALMGVPRAEAERWLRPASFVFVGTLVCASVRGFLNAAARAACAA